MAGVAGGAGADGPVRVGPADAVATDTAAGSGRLSLQPGEGVGGPPAAAGMKLLAVLHLLGCQGRLIGADCSLP